MTFDDKWRAFSQRCLAHGAARKRMADPSAGHVCEIARADKAAHTSLFRKGSRGHTDIALPAIWVFPNEHAIVPI